jgi:multiple sugar transport system ATP-binding protein
MAEVRLEGLSKDYGGAGVIEGLSLTIHNGELFVLVGPSGCGKSTLLHLLAGLTAPSAGRILFDGRDVTALEPRARDVAVVFQSYALYPHMTVEENLAFPLRVAPRQGRLDAAGIRQEVHRTAERLGITALLQRRPRELSGGQRQRVALGRALIRTPQVFLLDEPLSNLDAPLRASMRVELRRLHDELGITMIYVTHDHTEAMTLGDRLALLDRGRIRQVGTPQELYDRPADQFVAGFIGSPPMNLFNGRIGTDGVVAGDIHLPLPDDEFVTAEVGRLVRVGIRPADLRIGDPLAHHLPGSNRPYFSDQEMTGIVRLVEPTGGQTWVTVEMNAGPDRVTLVGLADGAYRGKPGSPASVSAAGATVYVFDAETGQRLRAELSSPAASSERRPVQ